MKKKIQDLKNEVAKMTIEKVEQRLVFISNFCIEPGLLTLVEIRLLTDRILEDE